MEYNECSLLPIKLAKSGFTTPEMVTKNRLEPRNLWKWTWIWPRLTDWRNSQSTVHGEWAFKTSTLIRLRFRSSPAHHCASVALLLFRRGDRSSPSACGSSGLHEFSPTPRSLQRIQTWSALILRTPTVHLYTVYQLNRYWSVTDRWQFWLPSKVAAGWGDPLHQRHPHGRWKRCPAQMIQPPPNHQTPQTCDGRTQGGTQTAFQLAPPWRRWEGPGWGSGTPARETRTAVTGICSFRKEAWGSVRMWNRVSPQEQDDRVPA